MNTISVADLAYRVMTDALPERQLVFSGKLAKRRMRFSNRMVMTAIKAYCELQPLLKDLEAYRKALRLS